MIAYLDGTLAEAGPLHAILDVGGVGYAAQITVTTAGKLPAIGQRVRLLTHAIYREDSATLYGFAQAAERDFFVLLVEKVTGVGPRLALTILSKLEVPVLQQAISQGDIKLLSSCPGIGKKTAERLVVELRDKLGALGGIAWAPAGSTPGSAPGTPGALKITAQADAIAALIALGYRPAEAEKAIATVLEKHPGADLPTEQLLRLALR